MSEKDLSPKEKWEERYGAPEYEPATRPVPFLAERLCLFRRGRALCLAAGAGRNAVYLAQKGYEVTAVDISSRGLEWCRNLARRRGVHLDTLEADLRAYDPGLEQYDLITAFYYFQPEIFPRIKAALKPGGHFIMETFSIDQLGRTPGPRNPAHLVKPGELLSAFSDFRIRYYEEGELPASTGDSPYLAALVRLIAEKPSAPPG